MSNVENDLINFLESKLNEHSPFTRADTLNAFDELYELAKKRLGSEDEVRIQEQRREWITKWHSSRLVFYCEMFRGDYMRTILRLGEIKVAEGLDEGDIDYLAAESINEQLRDELDRLDE